MKRLLAAGSGPIFQICKAFRDAESGRLHNPEFTLLEWYRPGFDAGDMMTELETLVARLIGTGPALRVTYVEAFRRWAGLDVDRASIRSLQARVSRLGLRAETIAGLERDDCLDLILSHVVQESMPRGPVVIHDFPVSQACLARVRPGNPPVAERFELFLDGIELANGYRELCDEQEQRRRFSADLRRRTRLGLPAVPMDARLLAALAAGLPDSSGVALGLDRLTMVAGRVGTLGDVLAFAIDRA